MATQTPKRDNLHGEEDTTPRFTGESNSTGHDDSVNNPWAGRVSGGSGISGNSTSSPTPRSELSAREANPSGGSDTAVGSAEKSLGSSSSSPYSNSTGGGSWDYRNDDKGRGFGPFGNKTGKGRFRVSFRPTRRNMATWAIIGLVGGGSIFGVSTLSGPAMAIQYAQFLQKHLTPNTDFGNDRTSKTLLYAAAGKGAQNGRLGVVGNSVANRWEKSLLDTTGLRPIYQDPNRRHIGYEIVDQDKARTYINSTTLEGNSNSTLEKKLGKGAKFETVGDRLTLVGKDEQILGRNVQIISLADQSIGQRRQAVKAVGTATKIYNIPSSLTFRLEKKRGGLNLHPLNKYKGKWDNRSTETVQNKRAKEVSEGSRVIDDVRAGSSDKDGTTDPADIEASEETKKFLENFRSGTVRATAAGPAVVVGTMCAIHSYGEAIEDYKYSNILLPIMRLGAMALSLGSQTMAGNDIDLRSLGVFMEYMYDKENKTSAMQAESNRARQNKSGGVKTPAELDLGKAGEKPAFFKFVDDIPGVQLACGVVDDVMKWPVIKQVNSVANTITDQVLRAGLGTIGTSQEEIMEKSMRVAAGQTVDAKKLKGASYGSATDAGVFALGNDSAISMGGTALTPSERSGVVGLADEIERQEHAEKSFAGRYLDPYDHMSVVGSIVGKGPVNMDHAASMLSSPVSIIGSGFSGVFNNLIPKAKAEGTFDYGMPKYGFSLQERADERFENPYENAAFVEPNLDYLNEKYGKCFSMKATESGIESGEAVNVFKLQSDPDYAVCRNGSSVASSTSSPGSSSSFLSRINPFASRKASAQSAQAAATNENLELKRYRFYLADLTNVTGMACWYGDKEACAQLGAEDTATPSTDTEDSDVTISEDAKELAKQILKTSNIDINAGNFCRYCTEDIQNTADGKPAYGSVKIDIKLLQFLLELGKATPININSITGAGSGHSSGSNHYSGKAVDFECGLDETKADAIGKKYGFVANNERCDNGVNHSHYSADGF